MKGYGEGMMLEKSLNNNLFKYFLKKINGSSIDSKIKVWTLKFFKYIIQMNLF